MPNAAATVVSGWSVTPLRVVSRPVS
jgi:hypothetical protein